MLTYGSGTYGTGLYGRVEGSLLTAQESRSRKTALKVTVINGGANAWEYLDGTALQPGAIPRPNKGEAKLTDQDYRWYRLQMGMCILDNGKIVRVRIGNGSYSDWNVYYQEITDPLINSQWTTWNLLYSGTHFAVGVIPATASTYHVYTAKKDGIYTNNSLSRAITGVIEISPVRGMVHAMFVTRVVQDSVDNGRVMDHWYSPNISTTTFFEDPLNYRWIHSEISALKLNSTQIVRAQVAGFHTNPRSLNLAESLTISIATTTTGDPVGPPILVRGFAGQAGSNSIQNPFLIQMNDGYYYLFYTEARYDADKTYAFSAKQTVVWQRSKDLIHWSEPVVIGYDNMNPSGIAVVETSSAAYLANNGSVFKRSTAPLEYDLSNYVSHVELEMPKSNQPGSAAFTVANPAGVHDYLINMTDCEVLIEAGLLCSDGQYRYVQLGQWWINKVKSQVDRKIRRLSLTLYDLWGRLDNRLRDNYNNIGQVDWSDWKVGKKNQLFNYYYRAANVKSVADGDYRYVQVRNPTAKHVFLYTGVKSHNGTVSVRFRHRPNGKKLGVVYRYTNERNYYWCYSDGSNIKLIRVRNGDSTIIGTDPSNTTGPFTLKVIYRWGIHRVYLNGVLQFTYNETLTGTAPGYAGVRGIGGDYNFSQFAFEDWQPRITTNDLIRSLLAMGDFHDVAVAGGNQPQLAVVWGPQTDLNSPAKALASLAEQYQLDVVWRNYQVEVGQFKDTSSIFTYRDEVINFALTEEVGRRINLALVDGREDSWIEVDGADTRTRGRQIVNYFDVPELDTDDEVRNRAIEEIRKGVVGTTYEATLPLQFDLWRMDGVTILNNVGESYNLEVQGIKYILDQGKNPYQRMDLELSPMS